MIETRVKNYDADKGYGFIHNPVPGERDIFVHAAMLKRLGLPPLVCGQIVEVEWAMGEKGPGATNLSVGDCPHCNGTGWRMRG